MQVTTLETLNVYALIGSLYAKHLIYYLIALLECFKHLLIVPLAYGWKMCAGDCVVMVVN